MSFFSPLGVGLTKGSFGGAVEEVAAGLTSFFLPVPHCGFSFFFFSPLPLASFLS
jgi:hypothetical protein